MSRVSDAVDRAGPGAVARHGSIVAADHPLATDAAVACLRGGGSATDAALCAALVHPAAALDGRAVAIVWDRDQGLVAVDSGAGGPMGAFAALAERFRGRCSQERLARALETTTVGREAPWAPPLEGLYRGHSVHTVAPVGLVVLETLALLDDWPMADLAADEREHLAIEATKLASGDAGCDPRELLSDAHLERRRDELGRRASERAEPLTDAPSIHVAAIDREGQCCALALGAKRDSPPFSAIVFRAGLPWIALGASGAETPSQILLHAIDRRMSPDEAVCAPRRRWLGGARVRFEDGFDPEVVAALEKRGHVRVDEPTDFGAAQIVAIDRDSHSLAGASDPRRGGKIGAV